MATHSGILAWEPGELQSMGSQRAGHGWAAKHTAICYKLYIKVVKRVNTRISQFSSIAQHTRLPCPSPTPEACSNPCPLSQWYHPTISSSLALFSSCPQSFLASGSFQMSQFFASGGQTIGASASESVFSMNIQDWFPLGWTGWISLQSKGLSRVFSNTTGQKH